MAMFVSGSSSSTGSFGKLHVGNTAYSRPEGNVVSTAKVNDGKNFVALGTGTTGGTAGYWFGSHGVAVPNLKQAIVVKRTGDYGIGDMYFVLDSTGDDAMAISGSDTKMTITSAGKVGIGTTSPGDILHVSGGAASPQARIGSDTLTAITAADDLVIENLGGACGLSLLGSTTGDTNIYFGQDGNLGRGRISYEHDNNQMLFKTNGNTTALTIDGSQNATFSGDVDMTQASNVALTLDSTGGGSSRFLLNSQDSNTEYGEIYFQTNDTTKAKIYHHKDGILYLQTGGTTTALTLDASQNATFAGIISGSTLRSSGDVVAYYASDERLKNNIQEIPNALEKVKSLRGVEFNWNELQDTYPSGSLDSGVIAQDVQKVLPQLVRTNHGGYLGVKHDRLVGLLIEGIKEQQSQIDDLKLQIKEIKDGSTK